MSPDRGILRHCLRGNARTATVPRDANAGARGAFASERAKACARFGLLRTGGTQDASSVCALVCGAGPGGTYPLARHGQQIPLATSPRTVQHPLGEDFSGAQGLVPQTLDEQTALSYVRRVPASLLKEVLLTGTPEDGIGQAAEGRDHGMRYLVVCNVSILQPSLRKGLAATAPFFKILRGLKKL